MLDWKCTASSPNQLDPGFLSAAALHSSIFPAVRKQSETRGVGCGDLLRKSAGVRYQPNSMILCRLGQDERDRRTGTEVILPCWLRLIVATQAGQSGVWVGSRAE